MGDRENGGTYLHLPTESKWASAQQEGEGGRGPSAWPWGHRLASTRSGVHEDSSGPPGPQTPVSSFEDGCKECTASPFLSTVPQPRDIPDGVCKAKFSSRLMDWFECRPLVSGEVPRQPAKPRGLFAKLSAFRLCCCYVGADNVLREGSQPQKPVSWERALGLASGHPNISWNATCPYAWLKGRGK